ncbi:META domain-containing protein [Chryseobacterium sp.]|uniref:META domain-containing protein n=1 Tax=Chryseobacterium sp. TaxID=1871047 RepID=UPI0011C6EE20|nr:META domain-containing protein [Chryseobacterium sp.]TXF78907.1 META domain-containing protein [Chryseobacterium sp.]
MKDKNRSLVKNIFMAVFAAGAMMSCSTMGSTASKVGAAQMNIQNTQWTLADNVKGKKPTMVIETGKLNGNGGCNNYFGEVVTDAATGTFTANNLGSTKMACDNMETERSFMNMLSEANNYVVKGNMLELYKGKLLLLKFNKL